ncbi:MAG TPA: PD-(D/E)XK nuclease family protein [Thermoplasmata archaeon]|nr:PD-(D/E)XK nuclease family protein [Thermoplasmata archaeon]
MDPGLIRLAAAFGLVLIGLVLAAVVGRALLRRGLDRRHGALVAVDRAGTRDPPIVSEEHRIVGRPDGLRRLPDGREIPIEIKHRATPRGGPTRSHRVQVAAYCLAIESATGRAPPYGVLRYSDGGEFRIAWDDRARSELLELRSAMARPYRGEATPSPGRCARCPWRAGCDVRAAD